MGLNVNSDRFVLSNQPIPSRPASALHAQKSTNPYVDPMGYRILMSANCVGKVANNKSH